MQISTFKKYEELSTEFLIKHSKYFQNKKQSQTTTYGYWQLIDSVIQFYQTSSRKSSFP